jgi:Tol biopolymer transport system component
LSTGIAWSPDGRHILFSEADDETGGVVLWLIPFAGGEPRRLLETSPLGQPRFHPDGTRFLFETGEPRGEIWLMEGW